ncbi:MAG: 3-dehydroquinate synthase [Clostridia bacterium]|nr:3-dehydroquinate synthase [Clostridia bacterium]
MQNLCINLPGREYEIKIEKGLLKNSGKLIKELINPCKAAIVTDSNVAPLYSETLISSLRENGFSTALITVAPGEGSKSPETLSVLYDKMLEFGITRGDLIIALGGGIVGDLAGFCASTLLRGIPFVQIPTTLLAQIDSSVGGKVAINLPQGKNLVGAFYQPKLVIIDPLCLDTLSDEIFSDGMAEAIKYGVILDEQLFEKIESYPSRTKMGEIIEDVISRCCELKKIVVEEDELDTGKRMILNFGHTFGHAIEKRYNFKDYSHGQAVACGMVMAAEYGEKTGITPLGTSDRIENLVLSFGLPTKIDIDKESLLDAIKIDKKGEGNLVSLILSEKIGKAALVPTEKGKVWIW